MDLCPLGVRAVRVSYVKEDMMTVDGGACVYTCRQRVRKVSAVGSLDSSRPSGDIGAPAG